jgi:hypothetical protein
MKTLLLAASSAIVLPMAAAAEFEFDGEVYLGFGSGDGTIVEGGFAEVTLEGKTQFELGTIGTMDVRAAAVLRTHQDELDATTSRTGDETHIDDDILDIEFALDMGSAGKLTFTSFNDGSGPPWADGELRNRGSRNVWPAVTPLFRAIKDEDHAFPNAKAQRDFAFLYDVSFGMVDLHIEADPIGTFNGWDKDTATEDVASISAQANIATDIAKFRVAANDLGDYKLGATKVWGPGVFIVSAEHQREAETGDTRNSIAFIHNARDAGIYKGFFAAYAESTKFGGINNFVVSTNWGGDKWGLMIATDKHFDVALEANYEVKENIKVFAAYDTGFANSGFIGEGFDFDGTPPPSAVERGENIEFGVAFTF